MEKKSKVKKSKLQMLEIVALQPGRYQVRQHFDETALLELSQSIKTNGLIQPIVVRPLTSERYEIIAGERRWRAAQLAGFESIACLVMNLNDQETAAAATIENIQREDLNPIEQAQSYQRLLTEFSYSHDEIAALIGKSRAHITNMLRLLRLNEGVQRWLISNELSAGHGKMIAGLPQERQYQLAEKAVKDGWSVRQLENEIKNLHISSPPPESTLTSDTAIRPAKHPDVKRLERLITDQVGAPVELEKDQESNKGWLKIRYFDYDTLAGLLEKIGVKTE